jgi:hypothetical protein
LLYFPIYGHVVLHKTCIYVIHHLELQLLLAFMICGSYCCVLMSLPFCYYYYSLCVLSLINVIIIQRLVVVHIDGGTIMVHIDYPQEKVCMCLFNISNNINTINNNKKPIQWVIILSLLLIIQMNHMSCRLKEKGTETLTSCEGWHTHFAYVRQTSQLSVDHFLIFRIFNKYSDQHGLGW